MVWKFRSVAWCDFKIIPNMKLPCSFRHSVICNCANSDIHDDFGCNASVLFAIAHEKMRWKVLHWPISQSAVQRSRNKQATARMTSLLIVVLTTRVACITRFDQWDIFNDVTFQNIPQISPDVVAEILCVAGSLGRRMGFKGLSMYFHWQWHCWHPIP